MPSCKLLLLTALALAAPASAAGAEQDAQRSDRAIKAFQERQFESAAAQFAALAEEGLSEETRLKAEYYLAQSLFERGLYYSAFKRFLYVIEAGPNHPHYLKAVEGIVAISEALREDYLTGGLLDQEYNDEFAKLPLETLQKINYIVGAVSYRKGKLEEALGFLSAVPAESAYYARARYLQGIILNRRGKSEEAIGAFNEILDKLSDSPKLTYTGLANVRELARLGLARVYFGMGRYADSSATYDTVPRFSEYWDEALFENGWARFQNDDWGGALGSLQALHAPQFAGSFQPESWILKATVYYYACLYDDSKAALEAFDKIYLPIAQKTQALLEADQSNEYYVGLMSAESQVLPKSVKSYLRANHRFVQLTGLAEQARKESEIVRASSALQGTKLQQELLAYLEQNRAGAVGKAGELVKLRLADAAKTVTGLDGQKEILKFEVAKAETSALEARFDSKKQLQAEPIWRPKIPATNWEYWQFQGEFWLDEIGYYQYTLKSGCRKQDD